MIGLGDLLSQAKIMSSDSNQEQHPQIVENLRIQDLFRRILEVANLTKDPVKKAVLIAVATAVGTVIGAVPGGS